MARKNKNPDYFKLSGSEQQDRDLAEQSRSRLRAEPGEGPRRGPGPARPRPGAARPPRAARKPSPSPVKRRRRAAARPRPRVHPIRPLERPRVVESERVVESQRAEAPPVRRPEPAPTRRAPTISDADLPPGAAPTSRSFVTFLSALIPQLLSWPFNLARRAIVIGSRLGRRVVTSMSHDHRRGVPG